MVVQAFKKYDLVPWNLRNRWKICILVTWIFFVSHIYREGNTYADRLVAFGILSRSFSWWDTVPSFIWKEFAHN